MPNYASATDLVVPDVALAMFTTPDKDDAIAKASQFADGYITQRFQLPLTAWGQDLREAVATIATYKLLLKRGFKPGSNDAEQIHDRYKDAVAWLSQVASGKVKPTGITDSSGGANYTDAAGEALEPPMVVQTYPGSGSCVDEDGDFWGRTADGLTGVGSSRTRGW